MGAASRLAGCGDDARVSAEGRSDVTASQHSRFALVDAAGQDKNIINTSACFYVRFSSQLPFETKYKRKGGRHCCTNRPLRLTDGFLCLPGSHDG